MLKRSLVSFAIIVSGLFLANEAYGQKEIVVWGPSTVKQQKFKSPTDVQTGQLIDTSTGEIVWADEPRRSTKGGKAVSTSVQQRPVNGFTVEKWELFGVKSSAANRNKGIFDVSTGEILW